MSSDEVDDNDHEGNVGVVVKKKVRVSKPPLYAVLLLNDDYTPMEFVVEVLEKHFNKSHSEATELMLRVHHEGKAICGVYPFEIAETKVGTINSLARQNGHPLQCTMEKS